MYRIAGTCARTVESVRCRSLHPTLRLLSTSQAEVPNTLPSNVKEQVDTVIIGGGVVGCSLAYHLAKQGLKDVVLLEKSELTAGSTWHAAGLTTFYHPGINVKNIHYHSINLYSQLEKETGQQVGFHRPGSLRLATSPKRMDEMKFQMSRQGWQKAPQRLLSTEEIQEMCPILNMDLVIGGLFNPYEGHIDPYSLTQALAIGARKYGAQLVFPVQVTSLKHRFDGLWEIGTNKGAIRSKRVINASGFWAREVGSLSGLDLPLVPIHHQYLVTGTIDEVKNLKREIPVLRHLDGSFYLRQERQGLLIGPYESAESMKMCEDWATGGVPPGFGKELFEPDLDRLAPHLDAAMELVPCFAGASIQTVVSGPICYSPDLLPMVGPTLIPGLWLAVGFGYGIIHAGGIGKYLSDWILKGEPPFDLIEMDPLRYGHWTTQKYTFEKARESYGMNNAVPYPNEERFAGRPTCRVSSAHEQLLARGAHMHFHSGWEQPAWFAPDGSKPTYQPSFRRQNWRDAVGEECHRVMNKVGIIDLSPFAKIKVVGPDATKFLDYVTANTVPEPGKTCISHCITPGGKVYAELTVTCIDKGKYFVVTGSGSELHDLRWLKEHAASMKFNVNFQNVTDEWGCLSVAGPNSRDLLRRFTAEDMNKFPFLAAREMKVANVDTLSMRISYTGELGWEIYCPRRNVADLYSALMSSGSDLGVGDFGTHALNVMRLEKGFRMWGAEMNMDTNPFEAGLDYFIKINKNAQFIGQEALTKQLQQGLNKTLVMLSVDSVEDIEPIGNETVWCCGRVVGNTTSGCYSHNTNQTLSFAYVPPYLATPGTSVQVELLGHHCSATVLDSPPLLTQPVLERKEKRQKKTN